MLPQRDAKRLDEKTESAGPIQLRDIEKAQQHLSQIATEMLADGRIGSLSNMTITAAADRDFNSDLERESMASILKNRHFIEGLNTSQTRSLTGKMSPLEPDSTWKLSPTGDPDNAGSS